MSDPEAVKIECPSCGQHYSLDLGDEETTITCAKCNAVFTASRIDHPFKTELLSGPSTEAPPALLDTSPEPESSRRPSLVDGFITLMFRFGKTFAGILAVVFLLGMLASALVFLLNLRSSIGIPTYGDIVANAQNNPASGGGDGGSQLDQRREIEKRYGDKLAALVKKHSLGDSSYDDLLTVVRQFDKEYRGDYVSGLEDVLGDAAKSKDSKTGMTPSMLEVVRIYSEAFARAEQNAIGAKAEAKITRWGALASILLCCIMLFLMLVIPALLKIEENTRRAGS